MALSQELTLLVEALTSDGNFVELFDQKIEESKARKMMEAAMNDARALDYNKAEGTIVVSLQNNKTDDDLDSMETDFVQFSADCAVQALHEHFAWDAAALREALASARVTRLIENYKGLRVPASDRRHEAQYEPMASLNMLETIDKRRYH